MSNTLSDLRIRIDEIDQRLIELLSQRKKVVENIGVLKKETNIPVLDTKRWQEVLTQRIVEGNKKGVPSDLIRDLWERIHRWSIEIETAL